MPSIRVVFRDLVLPSVDSITSDMMKLLGSIYDDLVDETLWARILIFRRRPAFISLMAQVALLSPFFYLSTLQTIGIDGLDIHLSQATLPTFCKLFFFSLETDWLLF